MSKSEGLDSSIIEEEGSLLPAEDLLKYCLQFKERGNEFFQDKQYERALQYYEVTISLLHINIQKWNKLKADCYSNCAQVAINLEYYYQAIEYASHAINIDPKHIKAFFRRGYAKAKLRLYYESVADYKQALILDPKNPIVRSELFHVLQILKSKVDHMI